MKGTIAQTVVVGPAAERPIGSGDPTGVLLVLGGVTCWSLGGVLVRLTEGIDAWQIILYRSLILLAAMSLWIFRSYGPR